MGIEEIEQALPNGLHDAMLRKHTVDYAARTLVVEIDVWVGNLASKNDMERERYEPGMLTFEGLEFFVIEPPSELDGHVEPLSFSAGDSEMEQIKPCVSLPPKPEGTFTAYFFLYRWNAFMHVCARRVQFEFRT